MESQQALVMADPPVVYTKIKGVTKWSDIKRSKVPDKTKPSEEYAANLAALRAIFVGEDIETPTESKGYPSQIMALLHAVRGERHRRSEVKRKERKLERERKRVGR